MKMVLIIFRASTTCTRRNNNITTAKIFDEFSTNRFCFVPKTCVECGLPATGLRWVIRDCTTCFLQHFNHVECCIRIQLINKTGYENLYVQVYYFLNEFTNPIIFIAVIAASSPLWPCLPPILSLACWSFSTVNIPKIVGTGKLRFS